MTDVNLGSISYGVSVDDKAAVDGLNKVGMAVDKTAAELESLTPASRKASGSLNQTGTAAQKAAPKMSKLAQVSQNASYQITDFTNQISGGQNAILALSQQLPQLLGGLGAVGAGIGAATAIIGGLHLALGNTTSSIEKFEKAVESAKAVLTLSAKGVAEYSDEMKKLNAISSDLAKVKIAATLSELERQTKEGAKALQELTKDATNTVNLFRNFNDVVEEISGKKAGADGFNAAGQAIKDFNFAVAAFVAQQTPANVRDLENALKGLVATGATTTKMGNDLVLAATDLVAKFKEGQITADEFRKALAGTSLEAGKTREEITSMVKAIEIQAATIGKTDRQTAIYAATLKGANEQEKAAINAAYDKIEAYEAEQQANKDRVAALKEYEAIMMRELQLESQAIEQKRRNQEKLSTEVGGIAASGQDPLAKLTAERDRQLALVAEYEALETANHETAVQARAAIDQQYESQRMLAAEQSFAMQSAGNKMLIDGLNSLSGTVSQVFTGMLTQTMSVQDAVRGLANAILNDAINSLVQLGLQYVKNAIIGQSAEAAVAATSAAAGATVAAAWAPAAAAVSLASYGANAAPAATGITATYGLTQALSVAGGRRYGGGVGYGSNYEVAEGGKTELYIPQSGNPMLMGSKGGQVVSNSDLMAAMNGGGQGVNVDVQIINQGSPMEVTSQQSGFDEATGRQFIKLWVSNFRAKGETYRAVTTGTNAKGRTD